MTGYQLGLYEKSMPNSLTIREKLETAKAAGYDFLELSIDETEEKLARLRWDSARRTEVLRDMMETELPIRSICLSGHRKYPLGHPDPAIRLESLRIMEDAVGLAADLGVRIIQLAGYDVYYVPGTELTRNYFHENLKISVEMAAKEGIVLAFETMETDFMNTVKKAMYWVHEIGSPYLQVYPDSGNITNAAAADGTDVADDLLSGKGHLAAVHLKETVPGKYREIPYGTGHVDFAAIAKTSMELGVRRYLAEFWYDPNTDWKQVLSENNRFLRQYLDCACNK